MKKKTIKNSWTKNRRFWILLGLLAVILVIVTAPIWFMYLAVFLISLDKGPSRAELLEFKQEEVFIASTAAKGRIDAKISKVRSLLDDESMRIEAKSLGDRCYIDSSGEFIPSYSKQCALRKVIIISSKRSSIETAEVIQQRLKAFEANFSSDKPTYPCFERESYPNDYSKEELRDVHWAFGPIPNICRTDIDQIDALGSDAEFEEHQNIAISTFNEDTVFDKMRLEKKKSYITIAFDDIYFNELMRDNY